MIKYIIFDLGGVFVSDAPIFYVNKLTDFTEVLEFSGVSREDSEKIWRKHWLKLKLGQESINLFWHDFYKLINNNISLDKIKELYNSKIILDKQVFDFAKKLKNNYKLLALVNESKSGIKLKIDKFKLNTLFEKIYCSANLNMAKPNPEIFRYVIKDSNLDVNEILFIDNQIKNVNAAKSLGIKSILFVNLEQLKKDLVLLSVNIS